MCTLAAQAELALADVTLHLETQQAALQQLVDKRDALAAATEYESSVLTAFKASEDAARTVHDNHEMALTAAQSAVTTAVTAHKAAFARVISVRAECRMHATSVLHRSQQLWPTDELVVDLGAAYFRALALEIVQTAEIVALQQRLAVTYAREVEISRDSSRRWHRQAQLQRAWRRKLVMRAQRSDLVMFVRSRRRALATTFQRWRHYHAWVVRVRSAFAADLAMEQALLGMGSLHLGRSRTGSL